MATKKKQNSRFINFLTNMAGGFVPPKTVSKTTLDTDGGKSISPTERSELIQRIANQTGPLTPRRGSDSYGRYIKPMTQQIAQMKLDNEAIRVLAPEIRTAENIVIPSIMSPTDMQDSEITILSTSKEVDEEMNKRISDILDQHFNKNLKLSVKLPEWIRESLYGAGSKPIMVLPITELDIIMLDPTAILSTTTVTSYSTESLKIAREKFSNLDTIEVESIFGLADSVHNKQPGTKKDNFGLDVYTLKPAIESLITSTMTEAGYTYIPPKKSDKSDTSYNLEDKFKGNNYSELKNFAQEALESISIIDNPDILKIDKLKKTKKKSDISTQVMIHYKTKTIITINPEEGPSRGNPVVYELPPESVVPVFTPGTPTDHIGYFVCIDEFGNPIHLTSTDQDNNLGDSRRTSPGNLYKSFGVESNFHIGNMNSNPSRERDILMTGVYETIIAAHLKNRLKESGFDNMYIGATENVYKCLFSRYLSERKTKMLFVPKDFITYFCFKHNHDGTGRSQIEDIKFILSLKITLMICRMMASMNSAINRKRINVNFTEDMGDPIAFIEMLKKEAIDKSIVNFTYDPTEVTRTLAQRALSVNVKGVPGAENFDVTTEPNEYRDIKPDDSLMEDVNNMMVVGLDIPPSAMNLLAENEFSRSVATNNLFFSRKIKHKQKIVCECSARYIKTYVALSQDIKDQIKSVLKQGKTDKKKSKKDNTDQGTVEDTADQKLDDMVTDVINNITCSLPDPDVAPNKVEFEELDAMIASISTALEGVFDNDLASEDPIAAIRAIVKSDLIRDYMKRIGVSKDTHIPDIDSGLLAHLTEYRHRLANTKKIISDITKNTTAVPTDGGTDGSTDTDTGGAPPSF